MNLLKTENQTATAALTRRTVAPRYEVRENETTFVVTLQLPGVERSAVETTVHENQLTVTARRTATVPKEWTLLHRESVEADFLLVLELDKRMNREAVAAELNQGTLVLTIPKAEVAKPRRIEIQG
jgi:HSP20 family protein